MTGFVTIRSYAYRAEAEIASARLSADGIRSAVRADDEGGLNPGFFDDYAVRLEVAAGDVDDALDSLGVERLRIPLEAASAIRAHAVTSYPMEACGLLAADTGGEIRFVACLTNEAASGQRFTIAPREHHGVVRFVESAGWEVAGVFHSHTRSAAVPSATDLAEGGDPAWVHVIIGPVVGRKPRLRAFRYEGARASELWVTVGE